MHPIVSKILPPSVLGLIIQNRTSFSRFLRYLRLSPQNHIKFLRLRKSHPAKQQPCFSDPSKLKIACILDEFSFECFRFEAEFQQIDPDSWKKDLTAYKPDLIFVEAAWRGKNGKWYKKVSEISNELVDLLYWARENDVPSLFWHKEVPPHFRTFLRVSKMFDFIFLTDADGIPKYRKKIGHSRVFFLPFACQPKIHNPVQNSVRRDSMIYAGTFYPEYKYPERYHDFLRLYDALAPIVPIDIYDRSAGKGPYTFPENMREHIRGSLPYPELISAYRSYEYGLNMNSVKHSKSMCARRVFELAASNTLVVGNYSSAVKAFFGDLTICSDAKGEITERITLLKNDSHLRDKTKLLALRKVLTEHTYGLRLRHLLKTP